MSTIINGTSSAITFPDSSVQNTSAIVSGYVPYANLPAGSVLQVVSTTYTTAFSTTSTTAVATGLNLSITPKFSTSKILIIVTAACRATGSGGNAYFNPYLNRNTSTTIWDGYVQGGNFTSSDFRSASSICYLDSPATTSSTNYALYLSMLFGSSSATLNNAGGTSSITLMEVAG